MDYHHCDHDDHDDHVSPALDAHVNPGSWTVLMYDDGDRGDATDANADADGKIDTALFGSLGSTKRAR